MGPYYLCASLCFHVAVAVGLMWPLMYATWNGYYSVLFWGSHKIVCTRIGEERFLNFFLDLIPSASVFMLPFCGCFVLITLCIPLLFWRHRHIDTSFTTGPYCKFFGCFSLWRCGGDMKREQAKY
ncbi:hypothetical protein, unlikely [Trypanosoma brucei gambiense DAL972]|uniref:Uncharacterized protein n=1 Tax=Trypanosoma brucei gambiense (strain MHOM/CI/86/DAL972) TaxID=679716 RepID=D0A5X6_TRYB9|nr:hypothetical protein, unlikely [Trypanosoma brucei gambiense DAL972]CBH17077.1 hypothetical protein, unlikely [Trypanosoma brucei gambiense DAL972]|eukprot:XP_011779341.1 hypothetical protein, unlikely [Trypanosoma brucei gambiense DAL972]